MPKNVKKQQQKVYYKCPCCLDPENNFYVQPTKNPNKMHCYCPDCKVTIFVSKAQMLGVYNFIEYWQKYGDGIVQKTKHERGEFLPVGGKIMCPCCQKKQTTMLQRVDSKGYFQLSCHWRKCHFQIFIPYGYLYILTEYSEN